MKVFISHTSEDKKYADLIAERLRSAGHDVWYDSWKLRAGDNLINKINEGIKEADAIIVIVSSASLRSKWVMHEVSAIALGEISNKKSRIIPVLVDYSSMPQYLARYVYVDFTFDVELGFQKVIKSLSEDKEREDEVPHKKRQYDKAISALSESLKAGRLTLVCGAGVSIGAGIPSWNELLLTLLESMMNKLSQKQSISIPNADANEFHRRYGPSALVVGKYLKTNLGNDFLPELRNALYSKDPKTCNTIESIVELARPQRDGKPLDSIITFNFDALIEENLDKHNIKHRAIHAEGVRNKPNELPIYHVHGYLHRKAKIAANTEIVFSEDAYHSQFIDPFSWSNLIQLNKLSHNTCLFLGISLTDPNLRRLLDVANRKNPSKNLNHFIVKKVPNPHQNDSVDNLAVLLEEQDANELGLNVIWVDNFDEVPAILKKINPENV